MSVYRSRPVDIAERRYIVTRRRRVEDHLNARDAYGPFTWDEAKAARKRFEGFAARIHMLRAEAELSPSPQGASEK